MKTLLLLVPVLFLSVFLHAQKVFIDNNYLTLEKPITFKSATAELTKEGESVLNDVKDFLAEKTYLSVLRVEGHVSNGNAQQSQTLSEQRALTVAQWLVANGVDCKRLVAVGFGDTKPIVANDSQQKAMNTRILLVIASLRGRAIGGMPIDGGGKIAGELCQ